MSGKAARRCKQQALTFGIDPASRKFRQAYRFVKRLYNNPNASEGGYNVY